MADDAGPGSSNVDGGTDAVAVAARLAGPLGLLARELRQVPPDDGLGATATRVLVHLVTSAGAVTSADLARTEQITPQSMSAVLATLESRGLVARLADPGDGRRRPYEVTRAGRRTAGVDGGSAHLTTALTGFDEVELELLAESAPLLERLARSLRSR